MGSERHPCTDGRRVLIDTGARPETVLRNIEEMRIDLSNVTEVVLTHNHADHTGGLLALRRAVMAKSPAAARTGRSAAVNHPAVGPSERAVASDNSTVQRA